MSNFFFFRCKQEERFLLYVYYLPFLPDFKGIITRTFYTLDNDDDIQNKKDTVLIVGGLHFLDMATREIVKTYMSREWWLLMVWNTKR